MPLAGQTQAPKLGIIGGTGINVLEGLEIKQTIKPSTPFGPISGQVLLGRLNGVDVALLNRHGLLVDAEAPQHIPPHRVNYRANLWALSRLGINYIVGLNAVGGISRSWAPRCLGTPSDLIDYTSGRDHTFFDPTSPMPFNHHVELMPPFDQTLRQLLLKAAQQANIEMTEGGVIAVTNGPRLETAAEVKRLENDGCELVGMTSMPEAGLAAELGLSYASLAFSVNWAAGKGEPGKGIHSEIAETVASCQSQIEAVLGRLVGLL